MTKTRLEIGTRVKLRRRPLTGVFGEGTKHKAPGGEGVITRIEHDEKGDIYWVRLLKTGREHSGRRGDLIAHRK
jgi:hypothetical protein